MTIVILFDIYILNVVVVVVSRNASIIWTRTPLSVLSLEAIILIRRIEVVSSIIVFVEVSIVTLAIIVVVRIDIVYLEVVVLSL